MNVESTCNIPGPPNNLAYEPHITEDGSYWALYEYTNPMNMHPNNLNQNNSITNVFLGAEITMTTD